MAFKVAETLWYRDPVDGKVDKLAVDPVKARASVAIQMGKEPYAYDWYEMADSMDVEVKTARHRIRQLACSEWKTSPVNSCYQVYWHDISTDVLLPLDTPFEKVPPGAKPVMFESPITGNKKWTDRNRARQEAWGAEGGRGNKKSVAGTIKYET